MFRRATGTLVTVLLFVAVINAVRFDPASTDSEHIRCELRVGKSGDPVPVTFEEPGPDATGGASVSAGTAAWLEPLPGRVVGDHDFWLAVQVKEGGLAGKRVWIRSLYVHPSGR